MNCKDLVQELASKSQDEALFFPIDRGFLERYLTDIQGCDPIEFIKLNLTGEPLTYNMKLFACLPEIWEASSSRELISMAISLESSYSMFSFIQFTYKYIEVDFITSIIRKVKPEIRSEIIQYLENQWNVLIKSASDLEDFNDGSIDVPIERWSYIKQIYLLDSELHPAFTDEYSLRSFVRIIGNRYAHK